MRVEQLDAGLEMCSCSCIGLSAAPSCPPPLTFHAALSLNDANSSPPTTHTYSFDFTCYLRILALPSLWLRAPGWMGAV